MAGLKGVVGRWPAKATFAIACALACAQWASACEPTQEEQQALDARSLKELRSKIRMPYDARANELADPARALFDQAALGAISFAGQAGKESMGSALTLSNRGAKELVEAEAVVSELGPRGEVLRSVKFQWTGRLAPGASVLAGDFKLAYGQSVDVGTAGVRVQALRVEYAGGESVGKAAPWSLSGPEIESLKADLARAAKWRHEKSESSYDRKLPEVSSGAVTWQRPGETLGSGSLRVGFLWKNETANPARMLGEEAAFERMREGWAGKRREGVADAFVRLSKRLEPGESHVVWAVFEDKLLAKAAEGGGPLSDGFWKYARVVSGVVDGQELKGGSGAAVENSPSSRCAG